MTGPCFVDTNILVYSRDKREAEKGAKAREWLRYLWQAHKGRITVDKR